MNLTIILKNNVVLKLNEEASSRLSLVEGEIVTLESFPWLEQLSGDQRDFFNFTDYVEATLSVFHVSKYMVDQDEIIHLSIMAVSSSESLIKENILNLSHDTFMVFDRNLRHVYVNDHVEKITGIPAHKYIGKTHEELGFPEHLIEIWEEALKKVLKTEEVNHLEFQLPNDMWIDWQLIPQFSVKGELQTIITYAREITDLKNLAHSNQEILTQLQEAFDVVKMAPWETNLKTYEMQLNPRLCKLIGYPFPDDGRNVMEGSTYIKEIVHEEDRLTFNELFKTLAQSKKLKESVAFEYRIRRWDDKKIVTLWASIKVRFNKKKKPVSIYGTTQDITELRSAQNKLKSYRNNLEELVKQRTSALKKSEESLKDALNLADMSTWEFSFERQEFKVGGKILEILSPDSKEDTIIVTQAQFNQLIFPEDWEKYQALTKKVLKSKDPDVLEYGQYRILLDSGEVRYIYISIKADLDENGWHKRHYGTIQDITRIKLAESEKERLTAIMEATPDIVAILDANRNLSYLNSSARDFFGVPDKEDLNEVSLDPDVLISKVNIGQHTEEYWAGERTIKDRYHKEVPISQVVIPHRNAEGALEYISTIMRDISHQKLIEEDLRFKNNELDTFVYRASHDLKGPISSLQGLLNVVEYELKEEVSKKYFRLIRDQVNRLNNILVNLMDITRIKEQDVQKSQVDFHKIIKESIEAFSNYDNYNQVAFTVAVEDDLHYLGDENIIRTIVQNLVENGIKYADLAKESHVQVQIGVSEENQQLFIRVSDNGYGIPKEHKEKIFNMFFRGDERSKGTGLGLYILKNAVEKLKGSIQLDSEVGVGSTFVIWLAYQS